MKWVMDDHYSSPPPIYNNGRGDAAWGIGQRLPWYDQFVYEPEYHYDPNPLCDWSRDTWPHVPLTIVSIYLLWCYFGTKWMKNRDAYDLRIPLILWNLFLSIFSFIGAFRTVPHLLYLIYADTLESTICTPPDVEWGVTATGLWVQLFIFSKVPELFDTFFIIVRKKKLIFLHWYHHVTVLLFTWHSYSHESSTGLYFVAMNYTVHSIMYFYYALMAMRIKPKWLKPIFITIMQITQMFIGIAVCVASYYYMMTGRKCSVKPENVWAGAIMYASYFILFVKFAIERFVLNKSKKEKKEK